MYSLDDTIAAISTPVGEGGIGIVRMTGPDAAGILQQVFRAGSGSASAGTERARSGHDLDGPPARRLAPYHLRYGYIIDPSRDDVVDEVLAVFMPAPRTYTRQDVVEINGHGGIVALRRILALCLGLGARLAEPGEFTARAFLHGRLDLAQAEAVLDIVRAKTEKSLDAAIGQLAGHLSSEVRAVRAILVEALAYVEASIDFVEDEIPDHDIGPVLKESSTIVSRLLVDADRGIIYRQGVRVAIVGQRNVGKSSLLNRLLRTGRAIVTDIPGTTRDTLEETLNLQGVPVVLVDTAGMASQAEDLVERLGIERSRVALDQADLALLVVDTSQPFAETDEAIIELIGDRPAIAVLNKMDLPVDACWREQVSFDVPCISISALTGRGLGALEDAIVEMVFSGQVLAAAAPVVTSPRHKAALSRALDHIDSAQKAHRGGLSLDFVAIDLTAAVNALGEITGQTVSEDLLETIFGNFCIGK
ncbi:tRNA uridine-5-carboxymethylaminomethyl(34) synthesis GTPase MnmE [Chloroflexota bacterium]